MQSVSPSYQLSEVVQLRTSRGRVRYLVEARRESCPLCPTGTRTVSIWATASGRGERVEWCGHCFNATCVPMALAEEHKSIHQEHLAAVARGQVSRPWEAVRPALEDLERRGLL